MTEYELLRIIDFLEELAWPVETFAPGARPDPTFRIVAALMRSHLRGERLIKTTLAGSAGVPFVTAIRRINAMIEGGQIELEPRTSTGRSHCLRPSPALRSAFTAECRRVKAVIGRTFGAISSEAEMDDFHFGGSNFARAAIPPPRILEARAAGDPGLRFLFRKDTYFEALRNTWTDLRAGVASSRNFDLVPLPDLSDRILENSRRPRSDSDVICVNMPWGAGSSNAGSSGR